MCLKKLKYALTESKAIRPTLAVKFVLLVSFILLLTFACIALFLFHHQREILYSDLRTLSVSLSRNLSANSVYGLLTRNIHNLSNLLDSLSNYEDVMFAWVEDSSGQILASYKKVPLYLKGGRKEMLKQLFRASNHESHEPSIVTIRHFPDVWIIREAVRAPHPISPDELVLGGCIERPTPDCIGNIYLGISLKRVDGILHSMQLRSLFLLIGIATLSMLITLILVHWIVLPLRKLKQATECVTAGTLPPKIDIRSRDEIGELTEAFNNMMEQVNQSKKDIVQAYNKLEKANQSLEETVEKRTAELKQSVSELTEARDELEAAYSELKQMYHAKAAFLRSASHELRTPLTAIKANVNFLRTYSAESLGQEGMEIMEAVSKNVNNMHSMVEEMLKMVRIDTGAMPLQAEKVNLKQLVSTCVSELGSLQAGLNVTISIPDSIEITADRTRLHDVFINLLSNAYRHTPTGGKVTVSAHARRDGTVQIQVTDTGQGIHQQHLSHLFEPFYQAHKGSGGTGLGLSIVKSIVERHGGTVKVESQVGRGTIFTINLPPKPSPPPHS